MKEILHDKLRESRAALLSRLDGLGDYDLRRPMTASGTNLLGLVKHLAGLEYGYLGESLGRPGPETLPWVEDGSIWDGADMWARPEESSGYLIGLYRRGCEHADTVIDDLGLDAPARVAHWPEAKRDTTLGFPAGPDDRRDRPARGPRGHRQGTDRRPGRPRPRHGRRRGLAGLRRPGRGGRRNIPVG